MPAVLPAVAIVAGAAFGSFHPSMLVAGAWAGLMVLAAGGAFLTLRRPGACFTVAVTVAYGAAGAALTGRFAAHALSPPLRTQHDAGLIGKPVEIEGLLLDDAAVTDFGASLLLSVDRIRVGTGWRATGGGVRLSVGGSLASTAQVDWRACRRVRLTASLRLPAGYRNPGARDEVAALARRGIALVGSVKSAALVELLADGSAVSELAAALRARVRDAVRRRLERSPTSAAIVTAILIGDRAGLDPDVERRLQEAGTYHVVAISGGNIAVLAALALALVRFLRAPGSSGPLVAIVALSFYGYAAGGGPSVSRATLAAVLYLAARALDHRTPPINALAVTLAAAVLASPLDVYDPGLALSFGAALALILGVERMLAHSAIHNPQSGMRPVLSLGFATVCAEIAVLPLGALAFGRVTAAGLALNFVAIPLMAVVQIAGLVLVFADPVLPFLSDLAARVADLSASTVMASTALLDRAPWLTWRVPAPPWPLVMAYYAAWAVAVTTARARRISVTAALCIGIAIASPPGTRHPSPHQTAGTRHQALAVTVLDVGQGDSTLVSLPSGRNVLVDAGGAIASTFDIGGRVVAPALAALGVRRLHALALTHPDPDHIGGAAAILRDFAPVEIWEGVPVPRHPARRALALEAARRHTGWRTLNAGVRLTDGDVEVEILHPPPPEWERQKTRNDDSLVLDVRLNNVSILLTGDIGRDVERAIIPSLRPAAIRILKAAHHGSATSTSAEFLRAVRPSAVIFSAGRDNRFGHPAAAVVTRVQASRAQIFRTDQDGAVTIATAGKSVTITTVGGRRWVRGTPEAREQ